MSMLPIVFTGKPLLFLFVLTSTLSKCGVYRSLDKQTIITKVEYKFSYPSVNVHNVASRLLIWEDYQAKHCLEVVPQFHGVTFLNTIVYLNVTVIMSCILSIHCHAQNFRSNVHSNKGLSLIKHVNDRWLLRNASN